METAFLALAAPPHAVTLPEPLLEETPERSAYVAGWVPVDQVRALLAHPSCRPQVRERIWADVARRAAEAGEPWPTVALGMAVPMLRRLLARAVSPVPVEACELQQEALAAVAVELSAGPAAPHGAGWERRLVRAADAARHRVYYRPRSAPVTVPLLEHDGAADLGAPGAVVPDIADGLHGDGVRDAYGVLVRAVQAAAITMGEAQLIARTRLRGAALTALAAERGQALRTLQRQRADAEGRLVEFLRSGPALAPEVGR